MTDALSLSVFSQFEQDAHQQGYRFILGVDEAGRGPLAGPVVAAAVALRSRQFYQRIADSKILTARQRELAFHEILDKTFVGVGIVNETVIDSLNILQSTYVAMTNAVRQLIVKMAATLKEDVSPQSVCLLIDGQHFKSDLPYSFRTIVRGDNVCMSIACASIVAKVIRDRILTVYDKVYPQYGFCQHKGYPTMQHREAIRQHGLSRIHRRSYICAF
jgi:ribonuclease HII